MDWYYLVKLANGQGGIAKTAPNQQPTQVGSQQVVKNAFLGTNQSDIGKNWDQAIRDAGLGSSLLTDLGPPGSESALIGSGIDQGTLYQAARTHGSGILTTGNISSAQWDPTLTIIAGGLGARAALAYGAVESAAEGAAAGAGAGAGGAASTIGKAVAGAAGALSVGSLFTQVGLWKGIALVIAGAGLVLIGILNLAGVDPGGIGKTARKVVR